MRDYILVNIYNEGFIPWIKKNGPLKEVRIGRGVYEIMKKDPRIDIELSYVAREREEREIRERYIYEKQKELEKKSNTEEKVIQKEELKSGSITEKTEISSFDEEKIETEIEEIIEEDISPEVSETEIEEIFDLEEDSKLDDEIKKELANSEEKDEEDVFAIKLKENEIKNTIPDNIELDEEEDPKTTKYSEEQLSEMTKAYMKKILKERGFKSGPNSGKYHDTVKILIEKILRTQ